MNNCELCKQGDPSINVRCWLCRELFHLHQCQLTLVKQGVTILGDCPKCGTTNCWIKTHKGVAVSGPVVYTGEPINDLRRKR